LDYSKNLQPPEKSIFSLLSPHLEQMQMLDIGVGGGRTTPYFASRVKNYYAIDFSSGMINACKKKFNYEFPNANFEKRDVRNLAHYPDSFFDFVLFSFNGLDNISNDERSNVLSEIRRIVRPGGYFCFSSHNLQNLPEFFSIRFRWHPLKFIKSVINRKKLIEQNQEQISMIEKADYLMIYDNVYDFGLYTYYSRPSFQIKQLKNNGFNKIRLFDLKTGAEISESEKYNHSTDSWIYYLCQ
jgi:ubiquinone/menaquinone biosynthesis C-methylase UbiE